MKLPKWLAKENPTRYYKIKVKGNKGWVVFTEDVRKNFVTSAYMKVLKKSNAGKELNEKDLNETRVVEDAKQLEMLEKLYDNYIEELRQKYRSKFRIPNYKLTKIYFAPKKDSEQEYLELLSYFEIEVQKV